MAHGLHGVWLIGGAREFSRSGPGGRVPRLGTGVGGGETGSGEAPGWWFEIEATFDKCRSVPKLPLLKHVLSQAILPGTVS